MSWVKFSQTINKRDAFICDLKVNWLDTQARRQLNWNGGGHG